MKIALALLLTIGMIAALMIKKLRAYKKAVIAVYAIAVIALFVFYNVRTLDYILPFYNTNNQLFYQTQFLDNGEYTDALLYYIVKDKNVYLPEYIRWDDADVDTENGWGDGGILCMNVYNILNSCGANVIRDPEMGSDYIVTDDVKGLFEDCGYLNDTMRYSFLHNSLESEYGNGFYYYWYYSVNDVPFKLYVYTDGLKESKDLCLLADKEFNFYLLPLECFEEEVKSE